jgi:hypothetical protein
MHILALGGSLTDFERHLTDVWGADRGASVVPLVESKRLAGYYYLSGSSGSSRIATLYDRSGNIFGRQTIFNDDSINPSYELESILVGVSLARGVVKGLGSTFATRGPLTLDAEIDAAFEGGRASSGQVVRFTDEQGPLSGSGPKLGQGRIWYHDNVVIRGAGPHGEDIELRTHSADPKVGGEQRYSTQINTVNRTISERLYRLPDNTWKRLGDMTAQERAAAHYQAD